MDYGNEEEVEKACLRPKLDSALFSLPPQVHTLYVYHSDRITAACYVLQIIKCVMADIPKVSCT